MKDHTILVQFQANLPEPNTLKRETIIQAVRKTLQVAEQTKPATLSVILATDDYIQDLNEQFRQINAPTDVLSFPADPLPPEIQAAEPDHYLGDIIIGVAYTARRATEEGRSISDEIALLVIHGTLHLLGYDHDTRENQTEMWAVQAQALEALGIDLVVPDYLHED